MFKRFPALLALVAVLALPVTQLAYEPQNLDASKREIAEYVNSGTYFKDVSRVAIRANKYIAKRLNRKSKPDEKLAIVLDIDETAVSNLAHLIANDYGYVPEVWRRWVTEGQAKPIVPVQIGYDMAVHANIAVFFVTARKENDSAATERNLREVGYETWTKIYYKPETSEQTSRSFKVGARKQIVADGYTIIANIGDQDSDLAGGYAERYFKLPNPFYKVR